MATPTRPAPPRGKAQAAPAAPPGAPPDGDGKKPKGPPPLWAVLAQKAGHPPPRKPRPLDPSDPASPPKPEGRPPRFVADPTLCFRICQQLAAGAFRDDACAALGVAPPVLSRWMHAKGPTYRAFREAVEAAEAQAAAGHATNFAKHAAKDWRASLEWLQRRRPEQWARRDRVTVGGDPSAPLVVEAKDVTQMTLTEVREYRARILEQAAAAGYDVAALAAAGGRPPAPTRGGS